jgi:hypothetical protein
MVIFLFDEWSVNVTSDGNTVLAQYTLDETLFVCISHHLEKDTWYARNGSISLGRIKKEFFIPNCPE